MSEDDLSFKVVKDLGAHDEVLALAAADPLDAMAKTSADRHPAQLLREQAELFEPAGRKPNSKRKVLPGLFTNQGTIPHNIAGGLAT